MTHLTSHDELPPPAPAAADELVDTVLAALPPGQHEPVIAAFRAFAAAAGELPQPGAALGWAGP